MNPDLIWRRCSTCKKEIVFGTRYYLCSVSTCQGRVTNYAFCSVNCWDAHVPIERHRGDSAGALERTAPRNAEEAAQKDDQSPKRKIVSTSTPTAKPQNTVEEEILVVVSKVKAYITAKSGMNTSAGVFEVLSDKIRNICDQAIQSASAHGRKTVMDRDVS